MSQGRHLLQSAGKSARGHPMLAWPARHAVRRTIECDARGSGSRPGRRPACYRARFCSVACVTEPRVIARGLELRRDRAACAARRSERVSHRPSQAAAPFRSSAPALEFFRGRGAAFVERRKSHAPDWVRRKMSGDWTQRFLRSSFTLTPPLLSWSTSISARLVPLARSHSISLSSALVRTIRQPPSLMAFS